MKRILVIGSLGMLGQEITRLFTSDQQYSVTAWDKDDIDLTRLNSQITRILKINPDIIINAAAYNAVDKCEENETEYELANIINGFAPGILAGIAKENNSLLIHFSTDYVFAGDSKKQEFYEVDTPDPVSNYGRSKLLGEQKVQQNGDRYYIIRLSKLFGRAATSPLGKRSFFDTMLTLGKKMSAENQELKVVDEELSCFTYAPDLAVAVKKLIETPDDYGIFHITNSSPATWYQAAQELFRQTGINVKLKPVSAKEFPRPAARPSFSILKSNRIKPLRSYQQALNEYLNNIETI